MDNSFFLGNLWRWKCGIPEIDQPKNMKYNIAELRKEQMSSRFISLMENRMVLGAFRYGRWQEKKVDYDRIGSALNRLKKFKETGNTEYLVDVANLCMIEFEVSSHPNKHFSSIDDGEHVKACSNR